MMLNMFSCACWPYEYRLWKNVYSATLPFYYYFFRAAPAAYRGSQARSLIRATAVSLHHSHSNARSEPHLQPIPQLIATPES